MFGDFAKYWHRGISAPLLSTWPIYTQQYDFERVTTISQKRNFAPMAAVAFLPADAEFANGIEGTGNAVSGEPDRAETHSPTATFWDIISSELVLLCITSYLPVPALLSLCSTNKEIRTAMLNTPGVWRTVDLSDLWDLEDESQLITFLRRPYVRRDCRLLILDNLTFSHDFLDNILLREIPRIRSISLLSCPALNGDQLIKLIDYIRRPSAPRPLSLQHMSLLGAPLFPLNQPSTFAPIIVAAAGDEIQTDLHSLHCPGKDHYEVDLNQRQWYLKVQYPNHPCAMCNKPQDVCMRCHVKKSCVGCHSYFCDECEPYPDVCFVPLAILIAEIGGYLP